MGTFAGILFKFPACCTCFNDDSFNLPSTDTESLRYLVSSIEQPAADISNNDDLTLCDDGAAAPPPHSSVSWNGSASSLSVSFEDSEQCDFQRPITGAITVTSLSNLCGGGDLASFSPVPPVPLPPVPLPLLAPVPNEVRVSEASELDASFSTVTHTSSNADSNFCHEKAGSGVAKRRLEVETASVATMEGALLDSSKKSRICMEISP